MYDHKDEWARQLGCDLPPDDSWLNNGFDVRMTESPRNVLVPALLALLCILLLLASVFLRPIPLVEWLDHHAWAGAVIGLAIIFSALVQENDQTPDRQSVRGTNLNYATSATPDVRAAIDEMMENASWNTEQIQCGVKVRRALSEAIATIVDNVPPGPDRTVAIRKLREARMDANSAITHNGRY